MQTLILTFLFKKAHKLRNPRGSLVAQLDELWQKKPIGTII